MRSNCSEIFFIFLLILNSCTHISDRDLALLSPPLVLDRCKEAALEREFFEEGGWPTERWWEMFEDPQLNELIEWALRESPTLQKALARVAQAEQEARKERAVLFPELDLDYDEQWQYFSKNGFVRDFYPILSGSPPIPASANRMDLTLRFDYEIDFFGHNRNLYQAALDRARAERAEAKQALLILTTLIAQTYIELQTKLAQQKVIKERLIKLNQLFELTSARNKQGLDPMIPVFQREQRIYAIEQSLLLLDKAIALDQHMLNVLIGITPDQPLTPKPMTVIFERPLAIPTDLSSDLLARRPDLTAQLWRVEAAAKDIGAAKADFYPRINLMAFAGLESLSFHRLFNLSSKQGGLNPAIHLPIFTGGRLTAQLKSKVEAFNEATYLYNELLLHAAREVADQIVTTMATFDAFQEQSYALEAAEDQLALQFQRYRHGIDHFLFVLESEEHVLTQHYLLLGLERDFLLSAVALIKALGGGYQAPRLPRRAL